MHALVAQLAEASGLGPEGWGFDSLQGHQLSRSGRVVDRAPLLREYTLIAYRGFESLLLGQFQIIEDKKWVH